MAPCGIGLGHITRTKPIADRLNRLGVETVYSTYLDGLDFARRENLPAFEAVPINFKVTSDGAIDFKMTAATSGFSLGIRRFLQQVVREIQFLKQCRPKVVFSDSRASSLVAAWLLRIPVILMLNQFRVNIVRRPTNKALSLFDRFFFLIANIGWLFIRTAIGLVWVRSKLILIPDLPAPYTISVGNLAIPRRHSGKVKLIGPITNSTAHLSRHAMKRKLGFDPRRKLVYAAVSGPRLERTILNEKLIDCLSKLTTKYDIVLSRGDPAKSGGPREIGGITVYDWVQDQEAFFRACDIMVSRAGHGTIMKSLVNGRPMVLIPIPDHTEQYSNARRAEMLRVASLLDQSQVTSETLGERFDMILKSGAYAARARAIGAKASKLNGIETACRAIVAMARKN